MTMRPLIFISYHHAEYARASTLASTVKWRSLWRMSTFMSDPQQLFALPVEELAERITAARAVVQLLPPQGETAWMAAERVLAESLEIPVLQSRETEFSPSNFIALKQALRNTPPFLKYASYLRSAATTTYDPEPPDVVVPRTLWYYPRQIVFITLALWLQSFTVLAIWLWIERSIYMRAEAHADEPDEMVLKWEKALETAFSRVEEYDIHLRKIRDEYEAVGMSATPIELNRRVRRFVGHLFFGALTAFALFVDLIARISIRLYDRWWS
jgi:hypothetical protein